MLFKVKNRADTVGCVLQQRRTTQKLPGFNHVIVEALRNGYAKHYTILADVYKKIILQVHQSCLQRWVDEKQKGGNIGKVACPQCQTEYIIVFPNMGVLVIILDTLDSFIYKGCPFLAAGIVVGAIYWCAVTYGAITVMQVHFLNLINYIVINKTNFKVVGQKEGLAVMEQADPLVLLIGLPAIPIALVVGKMVRWEDAVLHFMRRYIVKIPLLKHVLPFR